MASPGPETLATLQSKHPSPSRQLVYPVAQDQSFSACQVKAEDVAQALGSFYNGSAAGLDGIRPVHLRELTSASAGDNGERLLGCLTNLCNFLLSGRLNKEVCSFMYGASLCALSKKDGGLRPITVGSTFRRLTAKLGCRTVKDEMAAYFQPHQLGFGTHLDCEAAIHATRAFAMDPERKGEVLFKLDLKNAFNSVERDVLLGEVREKVPSLYPFLHQVYESPSFLFYNRAQILSQLGAQQGGPLGPLVFSLAIQKTITELKSPLNIWYLDDGTIGGKPEVVEQDLLALLPRLRELGLEVNTSKLQLHRRDAHAEYPRKCPQLISPCTRIPGRRFPTVGYHAVKARSPAMLSSVLIDIVSVYNL
ncbi:reverse transcriptase (RNA-dependent DNA polymerase) domain-containing protein [Phthorimaea operculella]|nr:reverse transcriptase (RNA-dependent DNA polymerase) domain-containing protein [Phthorimaea operculella]